MLNLDLQKIEKILSLVLLRVKNNTVAGFTDQAKNLEFLIQEIFNVCYGYHLVNTNTVKSNTGHFDLADESKQVKVQVTLNFNKAKLTKTLDGVELPSGTKVYLVGLESVSNSKDFNAYIKRLEEIKKISIEKIAANHLYQKIVSVADSTKIQYLLNALERHIDVKSLELFDDSLALQSILHLFKRDAVICHYSCEGSFSEQLKALSEIKSYIHRGSLENTMLSSNKPLSKFKDGAEKGYLENLDELLQDMIRAVRVGNKQGDDFFYYDQSEYIRLEETQQALINMLNENSFGMDFVLYKR
ncbi:hypothetical protein QE380_003319 [Acinetobacter baylyi]|uniref:SMEK domain-containing protein n=1 Tax=Acinetobacter baylyi TaxID=202950 RepID=A0ABU0V0W6_ACIBI|nr:SMEK domain-containing protein [Acinetobacter baylyi]MDQ1210396.1 hypothetical protein [Acinetobacter baylyi]MDR6106008.1 hypothetical protein [Acinetobacter baylyi]MDR6187268.1 hypothetical protein [Acinetobacter baylyi]